MSFERGWKAINLDMTDQIPEMEFVDHDEFIFTRTGIDTGQPEQQPLAWPAITREMDFDFAWNIWENWELKGRYTKLGHAVWSETDPMDVERFCPFTDVEDVLSFDPVAEYGIPPHEDLVNMFQANLDQCKNWYPEAVFPGGRYHSLFSACIRSFGWEMFMMAAQCDARRFDKVIEGFAEITLAEIRAWLDTDMRVFLMHDDIVWTSGPVFAPEWYRRHIFPRYVRFWEPVHEAGKKVIFCADGCWTMFVDDVAQAGADGFIFEPTTSLDYLVERYGKTHVIMGNADCRVLQYGTKDDIKREVERCVTLGRDCPGYFMCAGNHLPNGIPLENLAHYFEIFNKLRAR